MTILRYFFNDRSYDIFMKTQSWCDGIVKTRFKGAQIWTLNIYKIIDALLKINPYFTPLQRKSRDALFEIICNYSHWIIRLDNSFVYDREIYLVTFFFLCDQSNWVLYKMSWAKPYKIGDDIRR